MQADLPICRTCGVQYPAPREDCPICEDQRQYVGWDGQQWTSLAELRDAGHKGQVKPEGPGVVGVGAQPPTSIGQRALLVRAPSGNVLWDMITYIHSKDRQWVARPDDSVVFWDGDTREIGDGLTLINAGVHFDGGQVLHWAADPEGNGALFSGDIFTVVPDRRWVSFMYSYPNHIPERPRTIRRALSLMEPFRFDRIYGAWWRRNVAADGVAAISRSAERYLSFALDDSVP